MNFHDQVKLVPWKEEWNNTYLQEKERIKKALECAGIEAEIFHVGSTSIRDMISKPIIDILICPVLSPDECLKPLESLGYQNLGECNRKGRFFLSYGNEENSSFYVHLCRRDHPVAQDQLMFQSLERLNPIIFEKYRDLKAELACIFPDNRGMYRSIKGMFIDGVLSAYRQGLPEDNDIDYWILEFEMSQEVADKLQNILIQNEMTMDEFFKTALQNALDHPEEVRKWMEEHPDQEDQAISIRIIREYPVHKWETRAQARKKILAKEAKEEQEDV